MTSVVSVAAFVTAIIFIVLAIIISIVSREPKVSGESVGTVNKVIYDEAGNVQYYITFMKDGVPITGQSIMYSAAAKTLTDGENAKIKYAFAKDGNVQVMIEDASLESSMAAWTPYVKILWYIALPLLFISILTALI